MADEKSVLAAVNARAQALADGDPERLTDLLHEQFVWTSHRGDVFDRSSYVTANTRHLTWRSQVIDQTVVTVVGPTAVVVGIAHDRVDRGGEILDLAMRVTQTWVHADGRWRCLAGHAGPLVTT